MFYAAFFTAIANSALIMNKSTTELEIGYSDFFIGVAIGLFQVAYHILYQKAAQIEKKATNLALLLNMRDVFVYSYDILLLGNPLVWTNLLGAVLVSFSGIAIMLLKPDAEQEKGTEGGSREEGSDAYSGLR